MCDGSTVSIKEAGFMLFPSSNLIHTINVLFLSNGCVIYKERCKLNSTKSDCFLNAWGLGI